MVGSKKTDPILIIGAGVFGLSTALELRSRGYEDVTIYDRFAPPAPDGSSVDISRIIRPDYGDLTYSRLGLECFKHWRQPTREGGYKDWYHDTGFVLLAEHGTGKPCRKYLDECKQNLTRQGWPFKNLDDVKQIRDSVPQLADSSLDGLSGYRNPGAGWADSGGATDEAGRRCRKAGVRFVTGRAGTVTKLLVKDGTVNGFQTAEEREVFANTVILATGAWSNYLIDLTGAAASSAQAVAYIDLDASETAELAGMPVVIDLHSGWFLMPPTRENRTLKVAMHGLGWATQFEALQGDLSARRRIISAPRLDRDNTASSYLPEDADAALRLGLRKFLPRFADRSWSRRRLCWYTDTPDGNFIFDWYPGVERLFVATGGSGHGFKFLPIIGKYIVDILEDKSSRELRDKWALKLPTQTEAEVLPMAGDGSRAGPPQRVLQSWEQAKL